MQIIRSAFAAGQVIGLARRQGWHCRRVAGAVEAACGVGFWLAPGLDRLVGIAALS
jgi:hypothetical protein